MNSPHSLPARASRICLGDVTGIGPEIEAWCRDRSETQGDRRGVYREEVWRAWVGGRLAANGSPRWLNVLFSAHKRGGHDNRRPNL